MRKAQRDELIKKAAFAGGIAALFWIFFGNPVFAPVGAVVGVIIPGILAKIKASKRRQAFSNQLIDAILLIVSCIKAGLSFMQAVEVLVKEMPAPVSEEFESILKALKIGVSLEDAFAEMHERMPSEELKMIFSAILVARQTGGDLPRVLTKLVDTLRDRNKLKENIATYTIQGRLQGVIMGAIPVVFVFVVLQQDPHHFDIMFQQDAGRIMLLVAVVLQILAVIFLVKVSQVRI